MSREHVNAAGGRQPRIAAAVVAAIIALAIAAGAFFALSSASSDNMRDQGAESVRQAVLSAAMQCCAVEGSFPSTVEHLEEHYGLTVNHDDYVVLYEAFASNVTPSVTVVPR